MEQDKQENPSSSSKNNNENDSSDNDEFEIIGIVNENRTTSTEEDIRFLRYELNGQLSDSYDSNYFGRDLMESVHRQENTSTNDEPIQQPNDDQTIASEEIEKKEEPEKPSQDIEVKGEERDIEVKGEGPEKPSLDIEVKGEVAHTSQTITIAEEGNKQQEMIEDPDNVNQLQPLTSDDKNKDSDRSNQKIHEENKKLAEEEIAESSGVIDRVDSFQNRRNLFNRLSMKGTLEETPAKPKKVVIDKRNEVKVENVNEEEKLKSSGSNAEIINEVPGFQSRQQFFEQQISVHEQGLKTSKILNRTPSAPKSNEKLLDNLNKNEELTKNDEIPVPKQRKCKKIEAQDENFEGKPELWGDVSISDPEVAENEEDDDDRQSITSFASCHSTPPENEIKYELLEKSAELDVIKSSEENPLQQKPSSETSYIKIDQVPTKTRRSLGRKVKVADLYDSFIDEGCWQNIQMYITEFSTKTQKLNETSISKPLNKVLEEYLEAFNVEDQLALSLLSQCTYTSRYGNFLTDAIHSHSDIKVSAVYIHHKKKETLEIFNPIVLSQINFEEVFKTNATDIVVEVESGVVIPFSLSVESLHPDKNLELEEELKGYIKTLTNMLNSVQFEYDETQISESLRGKISLELYTDAEKTEVIKNIQTLQDAKAFIQDTIEHAENRESIPIFVTLLSLETLSTYIESDYKQPLKLYEPQKLAKKLIKSFSTTYKLLNQAASLKNYMQSNSNLICDDIINDAKSRISSWKAKEDILVEQLRQLLKKIRMGKQEESMLLEVLNGVNNLVEEIATWLQSDRNSTFEKFQTFAPFAEVGIKIFGKTMDWLSTIRRLKECIVFFCSLRSPGYEVCSKEAIHLKNEGYHVLLVDQDLGVEKVPDQNRLCYYMNGICVQADLLKEISREKMFCIVQKKKGRISLNRIKPKDAVYLLLTCPLGCSEEAKPWFCLDCRDVISYGFDENFYCKCGSCPVHDYLYRCNHPNHGEPFIEYEKDTLSTLLREIERHKTLNVLILGETGVGKSTFINSFANYLSFSSFDQACHSDLVCLIPSRFTLTLDDGFREEEITVGESPNENFRVGESSTQSPNGLIFEAKNWNKTIRLIDTPGIADVRGADQDNKNFEEILRFIENIDELHCILILLRPNSARLNVVFKYCIGELLAHLNKSAAKNIVFCFTNAVSTRFGYGDTVPILRRHFEDLEKTRNVKIPVNKETMYSFENDSFQSLCAIKKNVAFEQHELELYKNNSRESWKHSEKEAMRLIQHICNLTPHPVRESVSVNKARRIILTLSKPLAEITDNIQDNLSAIERRRNEMTLLDGSEADLLDRLRIPQISVEAVELNYPRTVCAGPNCIETRSVGNSNTMQTIYITHCHVHCLLDGVVSEKLSNPKIRDCVAIDDHETCRNCGCHWNMHMHIMYDQKLKEDMVEDPTVRRKIEVNQDHRAAIESAIAKCENQIKQYEAEQAEIMKISIDFGSFIKRFCMIPYNDAYEEYVKYLIRTEEHRGPDIRDEEKIIRMKELIKTYAENRRIIENTGDGDTEVNLSLKAIDDAKEHLFKLPLSGKKIEQFYNTVNNAQLHNYQLVEKRFKMPETKVPKSDEEIWKQLQSQGTMYNLHAKVELTKVLFKNMSPWITSYYKVGEIHSTENIFDKSESESEEDLVGPSTSTAANFTRASQPEHIQTDKNKKNKKKKKRSKEQKHRWNH